MSDDIEIVREDDGFYLRRGDRKLGVLKYHRDGDTVVLTHTEVDDSLRGQGRARQLLDTAVDWMRDEGLQVDIDCPYVQRQFDRDESLHDVLPD